jgi:hypothetical protein
MMRVALANRAAHFSCERATATIVTTTIVIRVVTTTIVQRQTLRWIKLN